MDAPFASSMATTPTTPSSRRPRRTTRSIALRDRPAIACGSRAARMPRPPADKSLASAGVSAGRSGSTINSSRPQPRRRCQQGGKGCVRRHDQFDLRGLRPAKLAMTRQGHDPRWPRRGKVARQGGQQRGLARTLRADDEHVQAAARGNAQQLDHRWIERPRGDQTLEGCVARLAAAQHQDRARRRGRRKDHHALAAIAQAQHDGARR